MAAFDDWRDETTQDKLHVFISSRLQECKEERTAARIAVLGLNHTPVLFEHVGARSIKPRKLYLSRLRDSQLMVAIYRLGYGYIDSAGGMKISGLEDEMIFAQDHGIPILLYVYRDQDGREPRLAELIDRLSPNVTIWFYRTPEELQHRIREDVTAEVTRLILRPQIARNVLANSPSGLLERASERQGEIVERSDVIETVAQLSAKNPILFVVGEAGVGKTTLVAQFSEKSGASFVRVGGLAPLDLFAVCSTALTKSESATFSTLQGALLSFSSAWAEFEDVNLVVDECDFILELLKAIELGGGANERKRIVITSRETVADLPYFTVPRLTRDELHRIRGADLEVETFDQMFTPLEAQGLSRVAGKLIEGPDAVAKEVVAYLALSPTHLDADELLGLLGRQNLGIEGLYDELKSAKRLIDDSPRGFRLVHENLAERLRTEIQSSPQRLRFYVNALEKVFHDRGDYRMLYKIASMLSSEAAEPYAIAALQQSIRIGDYRFGRDVAESMLEQAQNLEQKSEALSLMLSLIYPMEMMGDAVRASELLKEAEVLAQALGDEEEARVKEVALSSRARRTLAEHDVTGLEEARNKYKELGSIWDHARLGLELSALYMSSKSFEKAVEILRESLPEFESVGDDYGVDLAERNLAASLTGLPGTDAEVDQIVSRIRLRSSESADPRRQQAWYNNILTRRYRSAGRFDEAKKVAEETIQISKELGEDSLSAITYINLGNVLKDQENVAGALEAYGEAGRLSQSCGRRDIEADSSRLSAGVLNDIESSSTIVSDRYNQAKSFSQHAVGLLEGTIYYDALARSYIELAEAEYHLDDKAASAAAYFSAAARFLLVPDAEGYNAALIQGAEIALDTDVDCYLTHMAQAFRLSLDENAAIADNFLLLVEPIIRIAPKKHLVRILGRHFAKLWTKLPPLLRPVLLETLGDIYDEVSNSSDPIESWRLAYTGFLIPFLSREVRGPDIHNRIAAALTRSISGLDVRSTHGGDVVWTVVLEGERTKVVSIVPLDDTTVTAAAAQALALFFKGFEAEINDIAKGTEVDELLIQVALFDEMPQDIRDVSNRMFNLQGAVNEQGSAATRTEDFSGETPTLVFLSSNFLTRAEVGEGVSGSIQMMLGLTLVEVLYQLFKGEVDHDQLRPKVIELIRKTLS